MAQEAHGQAQAQEEAQAHTLATPQGRSLGQFAERRALWLQSRRG